MRIISQNFGSKEEEEGQGLQLIGIVFWMEKKMMVRKGNWKRDGDESSQSEVV